MLMFNTSSQALNSYEQNCIPCHDVLPASLEEIYKRYLLRYSSQTNIRKGMNYYLKNPSKYVSVMSTLFLKTYDIKQKTLLSDKQLEEAIDIYIKKYQVMGKLK